MMPKIGWFHILAGALGVVLSISPAMSMGQARETPLAATVLAAGRQCQPPPEGWRATWVSSFEGLRELSDRCRSHLMGAGSSSLPEVDFARFGVLAVEMGRRPSAGYGFDTDQVTAQAAGGTATVSITHFKPSPGAMTAQVITSPWILIQLPLADFHEIRVVDQAGTALVRIKRP